MSRLQFSLLLCLVSVWLVCIPVSAEFGVPKTQNGGAQEANIDADGSVELPSYMELAKTLQSSAPIDMQDAVDLAVVIEAAKMDPETQSMIAKLQEGEEGRHLEALSKDSTQMEIVQTLKAQLDELKAIEALFMDPQRAVTELEKEGLLGEKKKNIEYYRENPEALELELQRGVYFGFVSVAAAGGFMD